jgi:hypothetical protein
MVGPGECGYDCQMSACMCKVCFEEQHRHTIAITIMRAKVREGSGAKAPCKERAVVVLSCFITDSLDYNLVRERQPCDGRGKKEVFQDVASRTAHKLYSSSHIASSGGKFRMSLQEDIQQTTNIQYCGGHDKEEGGC